MDVSHDALFSGPKIREFSGTCEVRNDFHFHQNRIAASSGRARKAVSGHK
jgi:hypothetical protein